MSDTLLLNGDFQPIHALVHESLVPWANAIKLQWLGKITVLETYKDWHVHSPSVIYEVPALAVTKEYYNFDKAVKFTRRNVYLRDMFTCQYCGEVFETGELTFDHVLPKSHGGETSWENIVTACKDCNLKKGNDPTIVPAVMPVAPDFWALSKNFNYDNFTCRHDSWRDYYTDRKVA